MRTVLLPRTRGVERAVADTVQPPPIGALALFGVANYRRFAAGQSFSLIGSWTQTIAEGLRVGR